MCIQSFRESSAALNIMNISDDWRKKVMAGRNGGRHGSM